MKSENGSAALGALQLVELVKGHFDANHVEKLFLTLCELENGGAELPNPHEINTHLLGVDPAHAFELGTLATTRWNGIGFVSHVCFHICLANGSPHLALEIAKRALIDDQQSSLWIHHAAYAHSACGDEASALAGWERLIELYPRDERGWHSKYVSLSYLNRKAENLEHTKRWNSAFPESFDAKVGRAQTLTREGRKQEAKELLETLSGYQFKSYEEALSRGRANRELGLIDAALSDFDAAAALDASCRVRVLVQKGETLEHFGRRKEAITFFKEASSEDPADTHALFHYASALLQERELEDALRAFEKIPTDQSEEYAISALANKAVIFQLKGDHKSAVAAVTDALSIGADEVLRVSRATSLAALGRYEEALDDLDAISDLGRHDDARASFIRGLCQAELKQFNESLESFRRAAKHHPNWYENSYNIGLVLLQVGKPSEAKVAFESALTIEPSYQPALLGLSESEILLGNYDEARLRAYEALTNDPFSTVAAALSAEASLKQGELLADDSLAEDALKLTVGPLRQRHISAETELRLRDIRARAAIRLGDLFLAKRELIATRRALRKNKLPSLLCELNISRLNRAMRTRAGISSTSKISMFVMSTLLLSLNAILLWSGKLTATTFVSSLGVILAFLLIPMILPVLQKLKIAGVELESSSSIHSTGGLELAQIASLSVLDAHSRRFEIRVDGSAAHYYENPNAKHVPVSEVQSVRRTMRRIKTAGTSRMLPPV